MSHFFLQTIRKLSAFVSCLHAQKDEFLGDAMKFWTKGEKSEIDVLLELSYSTIGIEVFSRALIIL
jgi:hypothetical protein